MASRDLEMSSRVNGIAAQLEKFDFLFADNLSRSLQQKKLSAADGHRAAMLTCAALRSESEFSKFWGNVSTRASDVGIEQPTLPRRRRPPARLDGDGEAQHQLKIFINPFIMNRLILLSLILRTGLINLALRFIITWNSSFLKLALDRIMTLN